jgi:hypothetical protein
LIIILFSGWLFAKEGESNLTSFDVHGKACETSKQYYLPWCLSVRKMFIPMKRKYNLAKLQCEKLA